MRGPTHKRYLMLSSAAQIDEQAKRDLEAIISKRYPQLLKKAVWLERGLIVRTDNVELESVKAALEVTAGGVSLKPTLTSGSIGKLKKAAAR